MATARESVLCILSDAGYNFDRSKEILSLVDVGCKEKAERIEGKPCDITLDTKAIKPNLADMTLAYFGNKGAQDKINYDNAVCSLITAYKYGKGNVIDEQKNKLEKVLLDIGYSGHGLNEAVELISEICQNKAQKDLKQGVAVGRHR